MPSSVARFRRWGGRRALGTARSIQRRRGADPDHDHGSGAARAARVELGAAVPELPALSVYVLSFDFLGIFWNNHHHLLPAADRITGGILWANLRLLSWLSLVQFITGWMAEDEFAAIPTASYGVVLLFSAVAYTILQRVIVAAQGPSSTLAAALGDDGKGKLSMALYATSVPLALLNRWFSLGRSVVVALMWLVPDRCIESRLVG